MATKNNKRVILQLILDKIEPGWSIKKPRDPFDIETDCIFQQTNQGDYREAKVYIENDLFQNNKLGEIEQLVRHAVKHAVQKF